MSNGENNNNNNNNKTSASTNKTYKFNLKSKAIKPYNVNKLKSSTDGNKKKKENIEHIISNSNKPTIFTKQGFNSGNNNKASILKNIQLSNKTNSKE